MRNPNGFGSITKLTGKRRRPWMVRKTVGFDENDKQIMQVVGYYTTKAEALAALAEYNENPTDLATRRVVFTKLYELWAKQKFKDEPIGNNYAAAYNHCKALYEYQFADIKTAQMQDVIDACEVGYSTKRNIKILLNQMSKYAMANDISKKNYAELCTLPPQEDSDIHTPFTKAELEQLWKLAPANKNVQTVLILCYTGLRPTEFCKIKHENVHLEERYMLGGIKTAAGKNRVIPIAEKIYPFVKALYDENNTMLIEDEDGPLNYDKYRPRYFETALTLLPIEMRDHLPHDGRHTCATLLDNVEPAIAPKIIKLILGHASKDVTQKVYTHKTIEQLIEAINKI